MAYLLFRVAESQAADPTALEIGPPTDWNEPLRIEESKVGPQVVGYKTCGCKFAGLRMTLHTKFM